MTLDLRKPCLVGFLFITFFSLSFVHAYTNFIGYGYTSCMTCHYNANGNGPLTDYGRAVAASEISGRLFFNSYNEEELAAISGFLPHKELPRWWRPSIGYRGMYLSRSIGESQKNRYITMQADFSNVIQFDPRAKNVIVVTLGYVPEPYQGPTSDPDVNKTWISREHYFKTELTKNSRVYIGMMDKAYGVRIPDHEAFSRRYTYNAQNDQVHGILYHYQKDLIEFSAHAFAGNLLQKADVRQKGASVTGEYELAQKLRLGGSLMHTTNEFVNVTAFEFHPRWGIGDGSSIVWENGFINLAPKVGKTMLGYYSMFQGMIRIFRGVHYLNTIEYHTRDVQNETTRRFRIGPGIQYFPFYRVELRSDMYIERTYEATGVGRDSLSIASQLHIWF